MFRRSKLIMGREDTVGDGDERGGQPRDRPVRAERADPRDGGEELVD